MLHFALHAHNHGTTITQLTITIDNELTRTNQP
jgi:hypothetical protein